MCHKINQLSFTYMYYKVNCLIKMYTYMYDHETHSSRVRVDMLHDPNMKIIREI